MNQVYVYLLKNQFPPNIKFSLYNVFKEYHHQSCCKGKCILHYKIHAHYLKYFRHCYSVEELEWGTMGRGQDMVEWEGEEPPPTTAATSMEM